MEKNGSEKIFISLLVYTLLFANCSNSNNKQSSKFYSIFIGEEKVANALLVMDMDGRAMNHGMFFLIMPKFVLDHKSFNIQSDLSSQTAVWKTEKLKYWDMPNIQLVFIQYNDPGLPELPDTEDYLQGVFPDYKMYEQNHRLKFDSTDFFINKNDETPVWPHKDFFDSYNQVLDTVSQSS